MSTHLGNRPHLKVRLMGCGAALALATSLIVTGTAIAQDDSDTTTVVVTGIKKGIQDAIVAKKRSTEIVEAISAEDIGKLPDASIAESIARLPGIAAQRTNGRAQSLSIRGLGPDYTVTTLNGREQVSTNDNRSVEFDQYPSELISQVLVYKTPNAAMTTQGIAGTADLRTVRPLAFGKKVVALNLRREMNSEDAALGGLDNTGSRFSLTYIDQFYDKKLGIALGYAKTNSPYQLTRLEPWGDGDQATCGGCGLPGDSAKFLPGGQKDAVQSSNLDRTGYMAVIEWKPNDKLNVTLDAYRSDFEEFQKIARLEYPLAWGGATLSPGYSSNSTHITSGTFTNVKAIVENYANLREAQTNSIGLNATYDLNDSWTLMADYSSQSVDREDYIIETTAGTGPNNVGATDTLRFVPGPGNSYTYLGVINYGDFNSIYLTDPKGWGAVGRAGYLKNPNVKDEMEIMKLAATRRFDSLPISKVEFGVSQTDHTKSKVNSEGALHLPGNALQALVPTDFRQGVTDASFLGNNSGMISYDALGLYNSGFYTLVPYTGNDELKRSWSVSETITVAYLKADIDTDLFGVPLTGNIGVQSQTADQSATTNYVDGTGTSRFVTDSASYTDVLPSMNLIFEVQDDMFVRFGAGTTISRPRMDDMAAGSDYGVTKNAANGGVPELFQGSLRYWGGSGSNVGIKPWKANAYDLSFEKYFGRKGYISAAVFYKDLTSFIYSDKILKDYTGVPLPSSCATPAGSCSTADANRMGTQTTKVNGKGGTIQGYEFTASLPGEVITPALDGFGAILTASFNDSAINPKGAGKVAIPGLSKSVINTTVYYEKNGFSIRASSRQRDEFVGEVPDYQNALQTRNVQEENVVDAQLSYTIQEGPAKDLTFSLSGSNLTNEPFYLFKGDNVVKEEKYGSTYLFGISYKWQ